MKNVELKRSEQILSQSRSNVTFHLIKWDKREETFSIKAGGNINYTSLATGRTAVHSHDFAEIFLVLSGKIGHMVNGELCELGTGSLVFIRPSDTHCFEHIENESCELVNFSFQLELLLEFSEYLGNASFLKRFTAPVLSPTFRVSISEAERIAFALLQINTGQSGISPEIAGIKVKAILAELFIKFFLEPESAVSNPNIPEWLDKLCNEMKRPENLLKGLKALQTMAPCTPEHLCKTFRKHLNRTPTEFINELRVNHAAKLLADSDEKIYSIALDLGFQSLSRFYNIFRKYYRISPAKYRTVTRKTDIPI
ncbi:MAG: hypothetical protein A2017_16035 [Lentisphaerae bacterium GWF2_44_16]|nr:MAG: hypothetical protein A2017_16035 [Lentisphaerae bacterium GWF2_44_16]